MRVDGQWIDSQFTFANHRHFIEFSDYRPNPTNLWAPLRVCFLNFFSKLSLKCSFMLFLILFILFYCLLLIYIILITIWFIHAIFNLLKDFLSPIRFLDTLYMIVPFTNQRLSCQWFLFAPQVINLISVGSKRLFEEWLDNIIPQLC